MVCLDSALRFFHLPLISLAQSVIYLYIQFKKNLFSPALKYCVAIPTYCTSGRQASKYFCKKRLYIYLRISLWWWADGPGGDSDIGDSIILSFVPGQVDVCPFLKEDEEDFKLYFCLPSCLSPADRYLWTIETSRRVSTRLLGEHQTVISWDNFYWNVLPSVEDCGQIAWL